MENQKQKIPRRGRVNILVAGLLLIAVGVLLLLNNLGVIEPELYRALFSWQMLLIVLGVWAIGVRNTIGGVILIGVGACFMLTKMTPLGSGWTLPFIFIILGIIVLVHLFRPCRGRCGRGAWEAAGETEDGFVSVDNSFASVRHIVLDPVFRGARIRTKFSGTILDLKRTTLAEGETCIDLDLTFSGLELYVPDSWTVVTEPLGLQLAGVEDKRYNPATADNSRKLVIRGHMALSGIEIKS